MLVDLASLAALVALAAVFGVFVSAIALSAALWYILAALWGQLGGRRG